MATVLVVDDEPIVRDVVVRYLQRDGFTTLEAGDGDDARRLIETHEPSLVVLDVMLPGTDGLELCRWIRARSDLPVILLTARGEEADRIVGLELGADDYVTKPFSPRELAVRVRTVLRRANGPAARPQRVEFGERRRRRDEPRGDQGRRAGDADREGVRPAVLPRRAPAPGLLARPADGSRLGLRRDGRHRHRHRPHPPAAREDRAGPRPPRGTCRPSGASATGSTHDRARARRRRRKPRRRTRRRLRAARRAERLAAARRARVPLGLRAVRRRRVLRLGDVRHGRRREDRDRRGLLRDRGGRRLADPRPLDRALDPPRQRLGASNSRPATSRREPPRAAPPRSPSSRARSTRWPRASSSSSTRAASSSSGRATTCARRSPRCRRCSRRSRTSSPRRRSTCR